MAWRAKANSLGETRLSHSDRTSAVTLAVLLLSSAAFGQVAPESATLYLDFRNDQPALHGATRTNGALEFTTAMQYAEIPFSRKLDGVKAVTIGGWFFPWRVGEQCFMFRGVPEIAPQGERFFPRAKDWI